MRSRAWIGIALSLALSAWFIHTTHWAELGEAFASVHPMFIVASASLLVMEFALRAVRWKVLLRPVAPTVRTVELFAATVIGAAANTLLPARAGELAKPLVAARKAKIGIAPVIATAVMERVFDIFGLVCVLCFMLLTIPPHLAKSADDAVLVHNLKVYGSIFGFAALCAMLVFFGLATRGDLAKSLVQRLPFPPPLARRIDVLVDGFLSGLGSAREGGRIATAAALSVGLWFNGAIAIHVLFRAFSLDLPFSAACFTGVAIALTVALPQAPGFFGVFHVAIEKTLVLWGIDPSPAKAFAIVFWGVSFLPVTLLGLLALWREGLTLNGLWSNAGEPPEPEPSGDGTQVF